MVDLKYKTVFSSRVKCVISEEKDLLLSKASLDNIQSFIPNINIEKNRDLLPVSFNACVVNRANKNKDLITTATALDIYKTFIYKNINIEHDRHKAIGVILTAGFSEFGSDKPIDEKDIKTYTKPFNITLGGVVWRTVNDKIADYIEDCSDPESDNYLKISASWELGYTDYHLALIPDGSKNIEDGKLITDPDEIEKLKGNLIVYGGTGKIDDDFIYRCPSEGVLGVGIGFTENPAADVVGIAVKTDEEDIEEEEVVSANLEKNTNIISQDNLHNVKEDRTYMKITSLKDITDDNLKVITASAISEFVELEIGKINSLYLSEKENKEKSEKQLKEEISTATKNLESTTTELNLVKSKLDELNQVIANKQAEELFTARMASFVEEFELDDEDRSVIASQIKGLDETSFAAFQKNAKVFFKNRKKGDKKSKDEVKEETKESKASTTTATEENKTVVEDAIDKSKVAAASVPATPTTEVSLREKWANAFKPENITVKVR